MFIALIVILGFVAIFPAANNGEWGSVALGVVIVLLLLGAGANERRDSKAYVARRDYWADEYDRKYRGRR